MKIYINNQVKDVPDGVRVCEALQLYKENGGTVLPNCKVYDLYGKEIPADEELLNGCKIYTYKS